MSFIISSATPNKKTVSAFAGGLFLCLLFDSFDYSVAHIAVSYPSVILVVSLTTLARWEREELAVIAVYDATAVNRE